MESLALLSLNHRNLVLLGVGVGVSLLTTPLCRWVAIRLGIVDRPGPRKIHSRPIAYLGGLSFFFSLLAVVLIALFYFPQYLEEWQRKFASAGTSAHPVVPCW
jgi:UDP-N-acetylmuramyl pentapeptide phosphotransferase/UDP-N-acetylglucosamine-1-phosphate transferase